MEPLPPETAAVELKAPLPPKTTPKEPKEPSPPKDRMIPKVASPLQVTPKSESPPRVSPPKTSPPKASLPKVSPPKVSPPKESPPKSVFLKKDTPPLTESPPQVKAASPPKASVSPPRKSFSPPKNNTSPVVRENSLPPTKVTSPPVSKVKLNRVDSKVEEIKNSFQTLKRDSSVTKDTAVKTEKLSIAAPENIDPIKNDSVEPANEKEKGEESNGVGDKIKKFEKAAEDANAVTGRLSRPGSMRGRGRPERIGSDSSKEELPPPATPFKDNVHFDLSTPPQTERSASIIERQQSFTKSINPVSSVAAKWQRSESNSIDEKPRPEPQKIIKPEFKPMPSPVDVTIRSPSLGNKIGDQFPSHGTAFRNVAVTSSEQSRTREAHKLNEDVNTQNNFKTCKFKTKEKYSVSKGSSYFTRGSEEIWLVKKKDIEEIEERVLDSFRRAGGNVCGRSESMRPSSDSGQGASFSHATMGRNKRQMYARSESLDPQWAGARSQTLKRQTSVACTCGHDKKTRAKSAGAESTARPRSRSHGDDNNQGHVLDKYETLV